MDMLDIILPNSPQYVKYIHVTEEYITTRMQHIQSLMQAIPSETLSYGNTKKVMTCVRDTLYELHFAGEIEINVLNAYGKFKGDLLLLTNLLLADSKTTKAHICQVFSKNIIR